MRHAAVAAATALTASGCGFGIGFVDYDQQTSSDARVTTPVNLIDLNSDDGRVTITGGEGKDIRIHRLIRYHGHRPTPGQRVADGTLTFTRGCRTCSISYQLTVPAAARVRLHVDSGRAELSDVAAADVSADSGSVAVRDVKGDLNVQSDSGSVRVSDVGGALDAAADSGAIRADGIRSATAHIKDQSGAVRLRFAAMPREVRATTDSGLLALELPGGPYRVDYDTDSGGKDINVPTAPDAASHLYLRSDSGKLTVDPA